MKDFEVIFSKLEDLVDRAFDTSHFRLLTEIKWKPPMDVYETKHSIVVLMDVPGLDMSRLVLSWEPGEVLAISGYRTEPMPGGVLRISHLEIGRGDFERKVHIRIPVVKDDVKVDYSMGMLLIRVKKEETI